MSRTGSPVVIQSAVSNGWLKLTMMTVLLVIKIEPRSSVYHRSHPCRGYQRWDHYVVRTVTLLPLAESILSYLNAINYSIPDDTLRPLAGQLRTDVTVDRQRELLGKILIP